MAGISIQRAGRAFLAALLASVVAFTIFGTGTGVSAGNQAATEAAVPPPPGVASDARELPDLRTRTSRTYLTEGGDYQAAVSAGSLNYQDGAGLWQPIDNTLVAANGGYENKGNAYLLHLPTSLADPLQISKNGSSVSVSLAGASGTLAVAGSTATYTAALPGVDISYSAQNDGVKEAIRLASPAAPASFSYTLQTSAGLSASKSSDGAVALRDGSGKLLFMLAPPSMVDAAGASSGAVSVALAPVSGGYTLTLSADPTWLTMPARSWPVTIDPTFSADGECYLRDGAFADTSFCTSSELDTGYDGTNKTRTLIGFQPEFQIPFKSQILSARLELYLSQMTACGSCTQGAQIELHRMTTLPNGYPTWNTADSFSGAHWTTPGGDFDPAATDSTHVNATPGWYSWQLRKLVQGWVDGSIPNQTLLLKLADESSSALAHFSSSGGAQPPLLLVTYQAATGLRRQFGYEAQVQIDDRESLNVNIANGNLVLLANDLQLPGVAGFGLTLPRAWNSLYSTANNDGQGTVFAYGWINRPNLAIGAFGDVSYLGPSEYEVGFTKNADGSFTSLPGIDATLVQQGDQSYLLSYHQSGVTLHFSSSGAILSEADKNGNQISYSYSGGLLSRLTDTYGHDTTFTYNGSNQLTLITDPLGRTYRYAYSSTDPVGALTSYTDPANQVTSYTYDANRRLLQVTDPLGHATKISYYQTTSRVTSVTTGLNSAGSCPTGATCPVTSFSYLGSTALCPAPPDGSQVGETDVTDPRSHVIKYCYDARLRVTKVKDQNGNTQSNTYTSANGGANCTDANGYTLDDNPCSTTDALGHVTTFGYDANKPENLLWSQSPLESPSNRPTYAYGDASHPYYATSFTDARGKVSTYTYDTAGHVTSTTLDGTTTGQYVYRSDGQVSSSTDGNNHTTTYAYNGNGTLASVTDPLGDQATYGYDAIERVTSKVDPLGNISGGNPSQHTTSYAYDPLDRTLSVTDPLVHSTSYSYDADGNQTVVTDANAQVTTYAYDARNELTSVTTPDPDGGGPLTSPVTSYTYDASGNQLTEVDPRNHTTTSTYDNGNRLASVTTPKNEKTTYAYDANGNLTSSVDPRGYVQGGNPADYTTTYTYDAVGQQLTEADPLGHTTTSIYDLVGNLTSSTDANNHTTSYTYDAAGRVLTVTAPDSGVTSHTYDPNGNELTSTDANNHVTSSTYDATDRLVSETSPDPDGGGTQTPAVTTYSYDANGNLIGKVDPNGNATQTAGDGATTYSYDAANRLTAIDYSDSTPDATFTYDPAGNRLSLTDGPGTQTSTYDNLDRLKTVTRGSDTFSYSYDATSNITSRTYPDATVVTSTYDEDNRLAGVASGGATTSYAYDAASNLTTTTLPSGNGYVETRTYDRAGQLSEVKNKKGTSTLSDFVYARDPVGNPLTVTQTGAVSSTTSYGYDVNDRLTSVCFQASCPGGSDPFIRWTYDQVGNRLTEARPTGTTNYTYNARDEVTLVGSTSYSYDQNGNETAAAATTYNYDLENRMTSLTSGGTTTTYSYDGDGDRTQTSTGSQPADKTNYFWDTTQTLPQVALERDGNNALRRRYVYGQGRISMTSGGNAYYYGYDGLESVRNLTSSTGASEWTYSYEPFGTTRTQTQNDPQAPANMAKFVGELADPTGLYHLRARQYDPTTGRFPTVDPVPSAGASRYAYAANSPTTQVDPSGASPIDDGALPVLPPPPQPAPPPLRSATPAPPVPPRAPTPAPPPTSPTVTPAAWVPPGPGPGSPSGSCCSGCQHEFYYPYDRGLVLGRTDAGVDSRYAHHGPIFAIGDCRVAKVDPVGGRAWGGGGAMYFALDHPIVENGRKYSAWYTAETGSLNPKLHAGSRVKGGERVAYTRSGWQETGFYAGQDMNSQVPTRAGNDFRQFILRMRRLCHFAPGA